MKPTKHNTKTLLLKQSYQENHKAKDKKRVTMDSENKSALWNILKKLKFFLSSFTLPKSRFQPISLSLLQHFFFYLNSKPLHSLSVSLALSISGTASEKSMSSYSFSKYFNFFIIFKTEGHSQSDYFLCNIKDTTTVKT